MKRYLLIAGSYYYPSAGTGDWVDSFDSREEAEELVLKETEYTLFSRGPRKGQIKSTRELIKVNGREVDWVEVIDLNHW